eukprot:1849721-Pyramimonas_sp.AAC.1
MSPSHTHGRDPLLHFSPQPLVRRKIGTQDSHFPKGSTFQNLGPAQLSGNPMASWTTQPPPPTPEVFLQSRRGPVQLLRHMRRARS